MRMNLKLKKSLGILATVAIVVLAPMQSFAYGPGELSDISVQEHDAEKNKYTNMAYELLENEKDPCLKNIAIYRVALMTGESDNYYKLSGPRGMYYIVDDFYVPIVKNRESGASMLVGHGSGYVDHGEDKTKIGMLIYDDVLDVEQNRADMEALYAAVQSVKAATENMNDMQKINTIVRYIRENIVPEREEYNFGATAWARKTANCGGYSSLFYIFALNSGIDVYGVKSKYFNNNDGHAWNKVVVDGNIYIVDCTLKNSVFEYATAAPDYKMENV